MKNLFLTLLSILCIATTMQSQGVNQITIVPSDPTTNDSISIISDFSYYGNCSYSLVHTFSYLADSTIYILPTYCGYGDTTLCHSIDTFEIGTFPQGHYNINIEYHQGSICPISGFDAIIAHFDTLLTVSGTSASRPQTPNNDYIHIYPNPGYDHFTIDIGDIVPGTSYQLSITNLTGQNIFKYPVGERYFEVDLSSVSGKGIFIVSITNGQGGIEKRKIVKL